LVLIGSIQENRSGLDVGLASSEVRHGQITMYSDTHRVQTWVMSV